VTIRASSPCGVGCQSARPSRLLSRASSADHIWRTRASVIADDSPDLAQQRSLELGHREDWPFDLRQRHQRTLDHWPRILEQRGAGAIVIVCLEAPVLAEWVPRDVARFASPSRSFSAPHPSRGLALAVFVTALHRLDVVGGRCLVRPNHGPNSYAPPRTARQLDRNNNHSCCCDHFDLGTGPNSITDV